MAKEIPSTMETKLDAMLECLQRMDKRDRIRTWGGFLKSAIAIIPVLIFIWSAWYLTEHGTDLMKQVANMAASSAAEYTKSQSNGLLDELMKKYK